MPLYEYECEVCGHRFEVIQRYSDPPIDRCPKCGGGVRKLQSAPAFQFKGTGWYVTDYARKNQDQGSKSGEVKSAAGGAAEGAKDSSKAGGGEGAGDGGREAGKDAGKDGRREGGGATSAETKDGPGADKGAPAGRAGSSAPSESGGGNADTSDKKAS